MDLHLIPTFAITLSEDLLFFLVFGIFALIKFISARNKAKKDASSEVESDVEQARRTREIQEEIRRRIAENQKSAPQPAPTSAARQTQPPPTPAPVLRPERVVKPIAQQPKRAEVPVQAAPSPDIWQQLAAAQRMEEETRRKAAAIRTKRTTHGPLVEQVACRSQMEMMLHNPVGVRDAFILSEILSAPLSERDGGSCPGLR